MYLQRSSACSLQACECFSGQSLARRVLLPFWAGIPGLWPKRVLTSPEEKGIEQTSPDSPPCVFATVLRPLGLLLPLLELGVIPELTGDFPSWDRGSSEGVLPPTSCSSTSKARHQSCSRRLLSLLHSAHHELAAAGTLEVLVECSARHLCCPPPWHRPSHLYLDRDYLITPALPTLWWKCSLRERKDITSKNSTFLHLNIPSFR